LVSFLAEATDFSLCQNIQISSGVHAASCSVGTRGVSSPLVKWPGHEADHSHLVSWFFLSETVPPLPTMPS